MKLVNLLASLKLTFIGMLLLAASVLLAYYLDGSALLWPVLPLCVLATNLVAALLLRRGFRRKPGLVVFHLALLAILLLAAFGRMSAFKGRVEIVEGQAFDPATVTVQEQGPWHALARLQQVGFIQGPIEVDYASGLRRGATRSSLRLKDRQGGYSGLEVGDTRPLHALGYRFYTTSNKGYAVLLRWTAHSGAGQRGAVHFPSYPLYEWKQLNRWTTPEGLELEFEFQPATPAPLDRQWLLSAREAGGMLHIKVPGQAARSLRPSDTLPLPGGTLRFEDTRLWMGYEIYYDPVLPWLLLVALIGVAGLAWHYWGGMATTWSSGAADVQAAGKGGAYAAGR